MRILITGATGTIGRALAQQLVQLDSTVDLILLGRREDSLAALDDGLQARGARPSLLVPLDFSTANAAHCKELAQKLEPEGLDALALTAAMFTGLHPLDHLKPVDFDRILRVGLYGPYWLLHHMLPLLKQSQRGCVLGVSDDVGAQGKAFWGAYGMAKSGFDTMLEQLRAEAEGRLHVRRVVPPPVGSPIRGLVYPGEDPRSLPPAAEVVQPWAEWLLAGRGPQTG